MAYYTYFSESRRETCIENSAGGNCRRSLAAISASTQELQWNNWGKKDSFWEPQGKRWKKCKRNWDTNEKTTKNPGNLL